VKKGREIKRGSKDKEESHYINIRVCAFMPLSDSKASNPNLCIAVIVKRETREREREREMERRDLQMKKKTKDNSS